MLDPIKDKNFHNPEGREIISDFEQPCPKWDTHPAEFTDSIRHQTQNQNTDKTTYNLQEKC